MRIVIILACFIIVRAKDCEEVEDLIKKHNLCKKYHNEDKNNQGKHNKVRTDVEYLECDVIRQFVRAHNMVRKYLTEGKFNDKTPVAHMAGLVWDDELQKKAEDWAAKGEPISNPNRTIPSNRFTVGENIYSYGSWSRPRIDPREAVEYWVKQQKDYEYKKYTGANPLTDAYTQIIWEYSIYLGCAIDRRSEHARMHFLVVCYYGPQGNIPGKFPYKKAKTGQGNQKLFCGSNDCTKRYGNNC